MLAPAQEQIPMNRAQRRAAEKAAKRKPPAATKRFASQKEAYAHLLKPIVLLNDCRPFREGEVDLDIVKVRFAYDRLKDGTADEDDFLLVGLAINMAKVRAMEISEFLANEIEKAQDAMNRCRERYLKHGRFGFDGIGIHRPWSTPSRHMTRLCKRAAPSRCRWPPKSCARCCSSRWATSGCQPSRPEP